jgi:hypothetical protein
MQKNDHIADSLDPPRELIGIASNTAHEQETDCGCLPLPITCQKRPAASTSTVLRQIYLTLLLRLPSLYLTRVSRIIDDGKSSLPHLRQMIAADGPIDPVNWTVPIGQSFVHPVVTDFKHSWETFVDSLLNEWRTLNIVSVLLLSYVDFACVRPSF